MNLLSNVSREGVFRDQRLPNGACGPPRTVQLGRGDRVPLEVEPPVKAAADDGRWRVSKCVGRDDVDNGTDDSAAVLLDQCQQGLQPGLVHLAVAVQEDQDLAWTHKTHTVIVVTVEAGLWTRGGRGGHSPLACDAPIMRPLMSPSLLGFLTSRTFWSRWSLMYQSRSSFSSSEETQEGVRRQDQE